MQIWWEPWNSRRVVKIGKLAKENEVTDAVETNGCNLVQQEAEMAIVLPSWQLVSQLQQSWAAWSFAVKTVLCRMQGVIAFQEHIQLLMYNVLHRFWE